MVLCAEVPRLPVRVRVHGSRRPTRLPAFAEHDSLYRLLLKCCATDPNDRFVSAEELRLQMLGVLREVVATAHAGVAHDGGVLGAVRGADGGRPSGTSWRQLPRLRPDPTDPQADWLARITAERPGAAARRPQRAARRSRPEVLLARGQAALEADNPRLLDECVTAAARPPTRGSGGRSGWPGSARCRPGTSRTAQSSFNAVYGQVPGELAPKLALALACELGGELDIAENLYRICASTDATYVTPAAFGLARVRAARDDLPGSLAALELVPSTSRGYPESQRLKAEPPGPARHRRRRPHRGVQRRSPRHASIRSTQAQYRALLYGRGDHAGRPGPDQARRADPHAGDAPRPPRRLLPRTRPAHRRPGDPGRLRRPGQLPATLEPAVTEPEWPLMSERRLHDPGTPSRSRRPPAPTRLPTGRRCRRAPPSPRRTSCPACGAAARRSGRLVLRSLRQPAGARRSRRAAAPSGGRTVHPDPAARRAGQPAGSPARPAAARSAADGYCQTCGAKAPSARDHFTAAPAAWVGGVCDRGVQHHRNEDAMALWAEERPRGPRRLRRRLDQRRLRRGRAGGRRARPATCWSRARPSAWPAMTPGRRDAPRRWSTRQPRPTTRWWRPPPRQHQRRLGARSPPPSSPADRVHYANLGDSRVYFLGRPASASCSASTTRWRRPSSPRACRGRRPRRCRGRTPSPNGWAGTHSTSCRAPASTR